MNNGSKIFGYAATIILITVIFGWVGQNTWRELRQLHRSFSSVRAEDYYLPGYVETTIRQLNETVARIVQDHDLDEEDSFRDQSGELELWIRSHQDGLTTAEQRSLMKQIGDTFEIYVSRSQQLMSQDSRPGAAPSRAAASEMIRSITAPVVDLCQKLQASEQVEQVQFVADSKNAVAWIQELLITVSILLVALIASGMIAIYSGVIGPLRIELVKSRAQAIRNEKLASLGTLAAGVAHEIRNPLTAINVRLHSLKKCLVANSSEQEDALVIGSEIQRLEGIVQQFLQFARPAEPKFVVVSADSLLTKIQSLFGAQLEKSSIRLNLESKPDIWLRVDPHQIEQVLINLVRNSADSIGHDGTVTVRVLTGAGRLNGKASPVVNIEVSDTGKGMSPEVQKRIFDPFFTTKEEGTGLGLVIASRIIEKHSGTLECRSEPNHGTVFTILLPYIKTEQIHEPTTQDTID